MAVAPSPHLPISPSTENETALDAWGRETSIQTTETEGFSLKLIPMRGATPANCDLSHSVNLPLLTQFKA